MHANSPKSSGRQSAPTCGKREATQMGEKEKGREMHAIVEQRAKPETCRRAPKTAERNEIHVTSETVSEKKRETKEEIMQH
jgi:hypothetical protein